MCTSQALASESKLSPQWCERAQALLETRSLVARMKLLLSALMSARNRLQLLAALQSVDREAPE